MFFESEQSYLAIMATAVPTRVRQLLLRMSALDLVQTQFAQQVLSQKSLLISRKQQVETMNTWMCLPSPQSSCLSVLLGLGKRLRKYGIVTMCEVES